MQRCSNCILPETVKGIKFNKEGICNFCLEYNTKPSQKLKGSDALKKKILSLKQPTSKYDCLVLISGGRESTFILYYIVEELHLRPLAVNYNNDFIEPTAQENMKKITKQLGVDFIQIRSQKRLRRKLVRNSLILNIDRGIPGILQSLCTHCWIGQRSTAYFMAKKYRLPIVWGGSSDEKTEHLFPYNYNKNNFSSQFRTFLRLHYFITYLSLHYYSYLMHQEFPLYSNNPSIDNLPNLIRFFDYVAHDENLIIETNIKKLNWKTSNLTKVPWRFDCYNAILQQFYLRKLFGFNKTDINLSYMIRKGLISRSNALKLVEEDKKYLTFDKLRFIFDSLNLPNKVMKKIEQLST